MNKIKKDYLKLVIVSKMSTQHLWQFTIWTNWYYATMLLKI